MKEQVMIYEIKSSANSNSDSLFHKNKKYFYWNQKKFKNLKAQDFVFIINTHSRYVLFTKVNQKDILVSFDEKRNLSFFKDKEQEFKVSGKWDDFVRLEIISNNSVENNWEWKSLGSSETTYINGNRIDPTNFNRVTNINQLKKLSNENKYQKILNDCLLNFEATFENYFSELEMFLKQANTTNLKTKHYIKKFRNTDVKVSFGQGNTAKIPWISFLKKPFTTSDGIYPVYLYYKKLNKLILAYGRSETNKPKIEWDIKNLEKISNHFKKNNYEQPERYGDSYIFKIYDINNLPNEKKINQDLNNIISKYTQLTDNKNSKGSIKNNLSMKLNSKKFQEDCEITGLIYPNQLITRYISSLATKPFVLLSGLSGSGKTKLAQSFAQWICEDKNQYCIVPVGADWTNREPLLGYVNALNPKEYILPENGALQLIIEANKKENENKPYFLILDEMNLSHVERYFADFLSVMESKDKFKLHSDIEEEKTGVPFELNWPKNLFVVGTVNIDETTYMFSPKVLDRANVIEFRINGTEMNSYLNEAKDVTDLNGEGKSMGESFVTIATKKTKANSESLKITLNDFFITLQEVGAEFGYRTASEIQTLFGQINVVNPDFKLSEEFEKYSNGDDYKIDIAIMQKLLPKLHGSRSKLTSVLKTLAVLCYQKNKGFTLEQKDKVFETIKEDTRTIQYPVSLEKITRMYHNVISNGFTSYAEA